MLPFSQKQDRIKWAKEQAAWLFEDWKHVVFSDENNSTETAQTAVATTGVPGEAKNVSNQNALR